MKAWIVQDKNECECTVVFAETRGKARALARYTDACADSEFCDIEVRRLPAADKYYKDGKWEMSFDDPKDRIFLVKEFSFRCFDIEPELCEECQAKEYCDGYKDEMKWRATH